MVKFNKITPKILHTNYKAIATLSITYLGQSEVAQCRH